MDRQGEVNQPVSQPVSQLGIGDVDVGFVASVLSLSPRPKKSQAGPDQNPRPRYLVNPLSLSPSVRSIKTLRREEQAPRTQKHLARDNQRHGPGPRSKRRSKDAQRLTKYLDKFPSPLALLPLPLALVSSVHSLTCLPWTVADRRPLLLLLLLPVYSSYSSTPTPDPV